MSDHTVGAVGASFMAISLAFVVAGVVFPETAEALLRLLLGTLVVGLVLVRAHDAMTPARSTHDAFTPFDGYAEPRPPPVAPWVIRELAHELEAVDDPRRARETPVPWHVYESLAGEVVRRLEEGYGLRFQAPEDHAAIRALVAEPTWSLIASAAAARNGDAGATDPSAAYAGATVAGRLPLSRLDAIIDDLEKL